ncbi:hypothetical protein FRC02_001803 [Tulasnella sp. 418]|nr:hypothetical protein FRC02_001803 [Tulasnella sp. 418]
MPKNNDQDVQKSTYLHNSGSLELLEDMTFMLGIPIVTNILSDVSLKSQRMTTNLGSEDGGERRVLEDEEQLDPRESIIRRHLLTLVTSRHVKNPESTICPSEVARAVTPDELRECGIERNNKKGEEGWRLLMDDVRRIAWTYRDAGVVEALQKGQVLPEDMSLEDVKGPLRFRLKKD